MVTKERIELVGGGGNRFRGKGFTLIEILIVVAIIAILASVVLVGLGPTQREGRDSRRISDLQEVQNALELYYNHCGWYPGGADDGDGSGCGAWAASTPDPAGANTTYEAMKTALIGTTAIGVTQVAEDPTNVPPYTYQYGSSLLNSYTLAATLEDTTNAALKTSVQGESNGFTDCGQGGLYCISI